jgi:hypothetical protein
MRRIPFFIIALLLLLALLVVFRDRLTLFARPQTDTALPVDLRDMLPAAWAVVPNTFKQCDFDGDGEQEYLVIYRYDPTTVTTTVSAAAAQRTQIGGVIYDSQVNRPPQRPGNQSPYRPGFLTPYRLLPDIFPGKGQGFLGETSVTLSYWAGTQPAATCTVSETAVFGYSDNSGVPTRLSLFSWGGPDRGYLSQHFVGNARVITEDKPNTIQPIQTVVTYNRFNDRSQLCYQRLYERVRTEQLSFAQVEQDYTIDFCFGAPADPAYPEAVVVAALRGHTPPTDAVSATPTGGSFFTEEAKTAKDFPTELSDLGTATPHVYRILALSNPGTLTTYPGPGTVFTDTTGQPWVVGEATVPITATIEINGTQRETVWQMVSIANEQIRADVHWRINHLGWR